ncbi:uncharacterized protein LOC135375660 isoform X2 [Ornithodoros turicata]|uniref:uncharacterized protein LOC135375660 isoform X2 n=1 Tax=Ornithodoros turicata TaxID=34597 RepID=UPI0031387935
MIALTIIVVILTHSQLWDPVNACIKYGCTEDEINFLEKRIEYEDRLLTCSFFRKPGRDCPCWDTETRGSQCWDMTDARDGRCFNGRCYDRRTYESMERSQRVNKAVRCPAAHDYLFDPRTARAGGCYGGYCHKNYRNDV